MKLLVLNIYFTFYIKKRFVPHIKVYLLDELMDYTRNAEHE